MGDWREICGIFVGDLFEICGRLVGDLWEIDGRFVGDLYRLCLIIGILLGLEILYAWNCLQKRDWIEQLSDGIIIWIFIFLVS